nr:hypothetical protein [Bacillus anthracis]
MFLLWERENLIQKKLNGKQLGIKNKAQIKTWMKWHREGETYRFNRPVGKQSTLQKTSEEGITEIERSWLKK